MNVILKQLKSDVLVSKTQELIQEERRITTEILWHLREIESRRIFSELGYGSMFEMMTRHFGYSEGSAHRRLSAARLLKEMPEIDESLREGKLTLTTASLAQGFLKNEKKAGKSYSVEEKQELLKSLEGKSRLETERELATRAPQQARPEQLRAINETESELRVTLTDAQLAKLKKLKSLLSHRNSNWTFGELIEHLADSELKRIDPEQKRTPPGGVKVNDSIKRSESRYVPPQVKAAIWRRAGGCCEYVDYGSGRRCGSRFRLQIDHKIPLALGGKTEETNLRLLCRNCNISAAFEALGAETMSHFIEDEVEKKAPYPHRHDRLSRTTGARGAAARPEAGGSRGACAAVRGFGAPGIRELDAA